MREEKTRVAKEGNHRKDTTEEAHCEAEDE